MTVPPHPPVLELGVPPSTYTLRTAQWIINFSADAPFLFIGSPYPHPHIKNFKTRYVAPQQLCDKLHKRFQEGTSTNQKENTMFDFNKTTKQFEELAKRIQEVNEFWINSVLTSTKEFFGTKTK